MFWHGSFFWKNKGQCKLKLPLFYHKKKSIEGVSTDQTVVLKKSVVLLQQIQENILISWYWSFKVS